MVQRLKKIVRNPQLRSRLTTLQVISGRMRYPILNLLSHAGEGLTVKDLSDILSASPSRVSHQLAILKRHRLVTTTKFGRMTSYSLARQPQLHTILTKKIG